MFGIVLLVVCVSIAQGLIINVTEDGNNTWSCLEGESDCHTIGYVLGHLTNGGTHQPVTNVTINVYYSHYMEMYANQSDNGFVFNGAMNIIIAGSNEHNVTITCCDLGAGLYFSHSYDITISHMTWINCGVWHPTSANAVSWVNCSTYNKGACQNLILPKAVSALYIYNSTNVLLDNVHFTSNKGSGVSLYNVGGVVNIRSCSFYNHSLSNITSCEFINETTPTEGCSPQATGLYIEFSYCLNYTRPCSPADSSSMTHLEYHITNCHFHGNNNEGAYRDITDIPTPVEINGTMHWPFGKGGAMGVVSKVQVLKHFNLTITDNNFYNNTAIYGGGLYLLLQSRFPDHNHFTLQRNSFENNTARYNGGGACIEVDIQYSTTVTCNTLNEWLRNFLFIGQTNFTRNMAYWGGGVAFTAYPLNATYVRFQIVACKFDDNVFSGGGGAIALLRKEKPERELHVIANAKFYACNFTYTKPVGARASSEHTLSSSVHSEGIELSFEDGTIFNNNWATALRLSDTGATLANDVMFQDNVGFNGGGVALYGKSWITIAYNANVNFTRNMAHRYGGGIFYNPAPVLNMNMTSTCFVWYKPEPGNEDVPVEQWWSNVTFEKNHACQAGDAAYIGDPQHCVWPGQMSLFDPKRTAIFNFSGQNQSRNVISTPSKTLEFNTSSTQFNKSVNESEYAVYKLMPGDSLDLSIVTRDSLGHAITSKVISVVCYHREMYENHNVSLDACTGNSTYAIDSFNRQILSGSVLNKFKVYGPDVTKENDTMANDENDLVLLFKTGDPIPLVLPLLIKFKECQNGYRYHNESRSCVCIHNEGADSPAVVCSTGDTSTTTAAIGTPCIKRGYWYGQLDSNNTMAYHFCKHGKCLAHHHHYKCDNYNGYIKVPSKDNELCMNRLQGPMCSECPEGHTLSYNGYECIKCSRRLVAGLSILIVFGCVIIVAIIIAFVKLNVRIPTASFYGFLYFYSVVSLLLSVPLPPGLDGMISVIVSMTSLDFQILQYMKMCFFDFRNIHYEAIHYIYPIAITSIVFLIIKIDESGRRRFQLFSGETATQALCIILLMAYTSVSETSLNILLPLHYQTLINDTVTGSDHHWYVYVDPGVRYMDITKHLPYWLIAITAEILLVLPFSLVMFFAPWLMRYVNIFSKIKPICDEYHNCFHDNYRWFAGVYLLARQVMFLITALATEPETMAYLQQTFCLMLLLLVATLHPYRSHVLNIIDTLLLSLLTFLSFTADDRRTYSNEITLQLAVVGVASIIPFAVLVMVISITGLKSVCKRTPLMSRFRRRLKMQPAYDDFNNNESTDCESDNFLIGINHSTSSRNTTKTSDDLPPRFYDEEREHTQRSPLLRTDVFPRKPIEGPNNYHSINNKHATK